MKPCPNNPFLLTTLFILFSFSAARNTITPSTPLADDETLVSSNRSFALGFFTPPGSNNRYIGLWYNLISEQTILWVANRENPLVNSTGLLSITKDGRLTISDQTSSAVWSTNPTKGLTTPTAQLLDNGNLVVKESGDTSRNYAWQGFNFLTDTLIPGMKLGVDLTTGINRTLTAWRSYNDPSPSAYHARMIKSEIPELYIYNGPNVISRSGDWVGKDFGRPRPTGYENFTFSLVNNASEMTYSYSVNDRSIVSRLLLSSTGALQREKWLWGRNQWNVFWEAPKEECDSVGQCRLAAANLIPVRKGSSVHNLKRRQTTIAVTVSLVLGSLLLSCIVYFVWRKKKTIRKDSWNEDEDLELPFYDMDTVIAATDNFSMENKLGEGGFGIVYKGKLPGGQEVAVKRLSETSKQGVDEFKNEVLLIAKLQHRNLVRLLGCCARGQDKMLIYEYMPNKSLDAFLFDKAESINLGWGMRFSIIIGIARGLLYLHQDSRFRIIHRDLKASNVLLDQEMNPKISDFGLARIFGTEDTIARTRRVVGTYGYMSPEYAMDGIFSVKSDVFSFGVLVLEIVSGQRTKAIYLSEPEDNLLRKAWRLWSEGKGLELTDPAIDSDFMLDEITRCIKVGLLCVQENPEARPKMPLVVHMLSDHEGASIYEPQQPGFMVIRSDLPTNQAVPSINDITISLDVGR